jgi:polyhydroxyalkanoate synthesis regulator phasin
MAMIYNAAKATYLKFDALTKTMQVTGKSPAQKGETNVDGLLKRLKEKKGNDETKEQEPLEIALDYFIAIRKQRNKLKQEI